jgi:hypothetical protein
MGCSQRRRPCRYPYLRPCCRLRSGGACRSRRSVGVVRQTAGFAVVLRRWVFVQVAREAVSRRNVVLISAALRRLGLVVGV